MCHNCAVLSVIMRNYVEKLKDSDSYIFKYFIAKNK